MNFKRATADDDVFCTFPFVHIATKTAGEIKPCCRARPTSNIQDESLEEAWNNPRMRAIRKELLTGIRSPECNACWKHEDQGIRSMRQRTVKNHIRTFGPVWEEMDEDGFMPFKIPTFEAKLSNLCNLKCRMCHPVDSTSWAQDWGAIKGLMKKHNKSTYEKVEQFNIEKKPYVSKWHTEEFWEEFKALCPYFREIYFAGGEPLTDPLHYKVLHYIIKYGDAEKVSLRYATNMTKLNYKKDNVLEMWNSFKRVHINISIDGTGDIYNYIRQLGDYKVVQDNILKVIDHPKLYKIAGALTLQVYNIWFMPEIAQDFEDMGIELHTHRVNYPTFLDCRVIPPKFKDKIRNKLRTSKFANNPHFMDAINTLDGDMTDLIPKFIEFSDTLDVKQQVDISWRDLLPDMAEEMDELVAR